MKLKNTRGFTLIELLVVIAIIGILSSVVLASLNGAREGARDSRRQSDLSQLRTAMELYANDNGDYNATVGTLSEQETTFVNDNSYMQSIPIDPTTENAYDITTAEDGYCISATAWEGDEVPDNDTGCDTTTGAYSIGPGT